MNWKFTIACAVLCAVFLNVVADDDMTFYWRRADIDHKCEPFTKYKIDCNVCICGADGTPFCTKMACVENPNFMKQLSLKKKLFQLGLQNEHRNGVED